MREHGEVGKFWREAGVTMQIGRESGVGGILGSQIVNRFRTRNYMYFCTEIIQKDKEHHNLV